MFGFLLNVAVLGAYFQAASGTCTQADADICLEPIHSLRARLGIPDDVLHFPIEDLNITQVKEDYCVHAKTVFGCLTSLTGCGTVNDLTFKGLEQATIYLCDDTFQEYENYHVCLSKSTVISGFMSCDQQTVFGLSLATTPDEICRYIDIHFDCIRIAVRPHCGMAAGEWYVRYVKTAQLPLMDYLGCSTGIQTTPTLSAGNTDFPWATNGSCSQSAKERCMQPLMNLRIQLGIPDDVEQFPIEELSIMQLKNDYCVHAGDTSQCLISLTGCSGIDQVSYQGLRDSVKYLCDETFDVVTQHHACLTRDSVKAGLLACDDDLYSRLAVASSTDQICRYIGDQLTCIDNSVTLTCGTEAADWMTGYYKAILRPLMDVLNCPATGGLTTTTTTSSTSRTSGAGWTGTYGSIVITTFGVVISCFVVRVDIWV